VAAFSSCGCFAMSFDYERLDVCFSVFQSLSLSVCLWLFLFSLTSVSVSLLFVVSVSVLLHYLSQSSSSKTVVRACSCRTLKLFRSLGSCHCISSRDHHKTCPQAKAYLPDPFFSHRMTHLSVLCLSHHQNPWTKTSAAQPTITRRGCHQLHQAR
jgi:hypothetical protein